MRRRLVLGLVAAGILPVTACHAASHTGDLDAYCATIATLRDGSLIPDDITDSQAVSGARRTLDDLAKLAPSDIADDIDVLRRAMSAIGDIDFDRPDAEDNVEKVLNDPTVDEAAGKVGQFTQTACGAATPSSDDGG